MIKGKMILSAALLTMAMVATPMSTFAKGSEEVVHVSGNLGDTDCIAEYTGDVSPTGLFQSYDVTADKSSTSRNCKCEYITGKDFQCTGWVKIVDKKSNTGLRHSTTAALSNPSSGNMYKGAVRNEGAGKVSATSEWVHGWAVPRIFWDWID